MRSKLLSNRLKSLLVLLGVACFCFNLNAFAQQQSLTQVLLNVNITPDNDIILLPTPSIEYNPNKSQSMVFGARDLTVGVRDSRITSATCEFRLKPYGTPDSQYSVYTPRLTRQTANYVGGNCQTTLPASQQSIPRWDVEIRLINTNTGRNYGADISYFMAYGAIGVVSLSGVACGPSGC
jgi:hypothetical protein